MDREALYIGLRCLGPAPALGASGSGEDSVRILIEPRRLWPHQWYQVAADGGRSASDGYAIQPGEWTAASRRDGTGWSVTVRIPIVRLRAEVPALRPYRLDLQRQAVLAGAPVQHTWVAQHPLEANRLCYGTANPADFGWLIPVGTATAEA
jgi:hypothetical protein